MATIYVGATCTNQVTYIPTVECAGITLNILDIANATTCTVALPTLALAIPFTTSPMDGTALALGSGSALATTYDTLLGVNKSDVAWARSFTVPPYIGIPATFDSFAAGIVYVADGDSAAPTSAAVFLWAEGLPAPPRNA